MKRGGKGYGIKNRTAPRIGGTRNAAGHIDSVMGRQKPRAIAYKASSRKS